MPKTSHCKKKLTRYQDFEPLNHIEHLVVKGEKIYRKVSRGGGNIKSCAMTEAGVLFEHELWHFLVPCPSMTIASD